MMLTGMPRGTCLPFPLPLQRHTASGWLSLGFIREERTRKKTIEDEEKQKPNHLAHEQIDRCMGFLHQVHQTKKGNTSAESKQK
jgi:hypothetical protein